jgi:rhomboid family GlyGly-CTERM serine protease
MSCLEPWLTVNSGNHSKPLLAGPTRMDPARLLHRPTLQAWLAPLALASIMLVLQALGPDAVAALRYERAAVLDGQFWRLVTGHLVHADLHHLAWNLAGLALVAWLFGADYGHRGWLVILTASTVAVDLGFLVLEPRLDWYVGFSGVLHGLMAAGLLRWLRLQRDAVTAIVTVLFVAKLAWEQCVGPVPFTAQTLAVPVVFQAHTYGAVGGLLAGLGLSRRRARQGASV